MSWTACGIPNVFNPICRNSTQNKWHPICADSRDSVGKVSITAPWFLSPVISPQLYKHRRASLNNNSYVCKLNFFEIIIYINWRKGTSPFHKHRNKLFAGISRTACVRLSESLPGCDYGIWSPNHWYSTPVKTISFSLLNFLFVIDVIVLWIFDSKANAFFLLPSQVGQTPECRMCWQFHDFPFLESELDRWHHQSWNVQLQASWLSSWKHESLLGPISWNTHTRALRTVTFYSEEKTQRVQRQTLKWPMSSGKLNHMKTTCPGEFLPNCLRCHG